LLRGAVFNSAEFQLKSVMALVFRSRRLHGEFIAGCEGGEGNVLYLKTHDFHWNVTGPMFRTLHLMFEEQCRKLALAVDSIAERIRAFDFPAPGAYSVYARLSSIKKEEEVPSAKDMNEQLVQGQEAVTRIMRGLFPLLDKVSDEPTANLLTQRMQVVSPRWRCSLRNTLRA
jgi:starvation-inducible DNA-binding protein